MVRGLARGLRVNIGDSFLELLPQQPHLWFVCTRPNRDGEAVIFSLTTLRETTFDPTCIVKPGEHPFVEHDSIILFRKGRFLLAATHARWLQQGWIRPKESATDPLILRIREGALTSPYTPAYLQHEIRRCNWRPQAEGGG